MPRGGGRRGPERVAEGGGGRPAPPPPSAPGFPSARPRAASLSGRASSGRRFFLVLVRGFCGSPGAGMAAGRRSAGLRLCATGRGRPGAMGVGAMGRARAGTLSRVGSGLGGSPAGFRRGAGILRNIPAFWVLPLTRMCRGPGPEKDAPGFRLILCSVWQEVSAAPTPFIGVKAPPAQLVARPCFGFRF